MVADDLTFSNVTTDAVQWDSSGSLTGSGTEDDLVLTPIPAGTEAAAGVAVLDNLSPTTIPPLSLGDAWLLSVQQVCTRAIAVPRLFTG